MQPKPINDAPKDRELLLFCSDRGRWVIGRFRAGVKNGKQVVRHECWIDQSATVIRPVLYCDLPEVPQ